MLIQTAEPQAEPVSLAQAKLHLRIDSDITDQDAVIDMEADGEWADSIARDLGIYAAPVAMQEAA